MLPNVKLKTRCKQLLGSLPLDIALSAYADSQCNEENEVLRV
jgi:hypothetical protein